MEQHNMDLFLTFFAMVVAISYVFFYMLSGRNINPITYRYQKVLNNKNALFGHLLFASGLCLVGIFRCDKPTLETYYFSPLIFLTLLLLSNAVIRQLYGRNIIIEVRGKFNLSTRVNKKATFLDVFFGFLTVLMSLTVPLIMKADKFKEMNTKKGIGHLHFSPAKSENKGLTSLFG